VQGASKHAAGVVSVVLSPLAPARAGQRQPSPAGRSFPALRCAALLTCSARWFFGPSPASTTAVSAQRPSPAARGGAGVPPGSQTHEGSVLLHTWRERDVSSPRPCLLFCLFRDAANSSFVCTGQDGGGFVGALLHSSEAKFDALPSTKVLCLCH
jgi:hypothetical protein